MAVCSVLMLLTETCMSTIAEFP